ncbi:MAG: flagellar hook capping FlgD N-terminal domain-containing protein [Thermodesulfobacteriota bacterium]|nr:flagellar hook capping FlgD N-terminal domain-containing protein [Thermodesulfobacteriota bacterium]
MTTISGIDTGYTAPTLPSNTSDVSMGKDDFLMLLVAQLENQDPMNPEDASEFASQLAEYSSLEQLTNIDKSLEGLTTMSTEMERMSALGLIGQDVVAQSDQFHFSGDPVQLGYRLNAPAEEVNLYVLSATGSTLATIPAQATAAGEHFIDWDGNTDYGMSLEPGDYSLAIRAVDSDDNLVQSESLIRGRVETVDMSGVAVRLETASGIFSMSQIEKAGAPL